MLSSFITYLCCTVWHTDPAVPQDYLWLCPELGTHSFFRITTSKVTCRVLGLNWWGVVRLINIPPHTPFLMTWKKCRVPSSDYARLGSNPGPVPTFASQKIGIQERAVYINQTFPPFLLARYTVYTYVCIQKMPLKSTHRKT